MMFKVTWNDGEATTGSDAEARTLVGALTAVGKFGVKFEEVPETPKPKRMVNRKVV